VYRRSMRRLAALVLVLAAAVVAPAADAATPTSFTVIATQTQSKQGTNSITFRESLTSGKTVIGHDLVTCKTLTKSSLHCDATFTFRRGTVHAVGKILFSKLHNVLAIVGGTRRFKGAKGTMTLADVTSKASAERFEFH
jgi:hypothetical protein